MAYTLSEIRPDDLHTQKKLVALLEGVGITLDGNLDYTCGLFDEDYQLVATGSTFGCTLRCFAVDCRHQGEGLLNQVVSHLMERQTERGIFHQFVYTKCESAKFFQSLGFYEIARVGGDLSFLENRRGGFSSFCKRLEQDRRPGQSGAIVMNANPFTLGHLSLVEQAAKGCDTVHLFVLSEEASLVPFDVRWKLVTEGVAHLNNVICHPSGPYMISSATFPSYFLKDKQAVITGHARLDLALFGSIAQALGVSVRYVGEEPRSMVTGLYNQIMAQELPKIGIQCVEVPRTRAGGQVISASTVRQAIHDGQLEEIRSQLPQTTWDFFHSSQAQPVIDAIRCSAQIIHY